MKGLQGERLRQAFAYFDKSETGVSLLLMIVSADLSPYYLPLLFTCFV